MKVAYPARKTTPLKNMGFILLALLLGIVVFKVSPGITGFITKEYSYADTSKIVVASSGSVQFEPQAIGELLSLSIDGTIENNGSAKVYVESKGRRMLVFDSASLGTALLENAANASNQITGFSIAKNSTGGLLQETLPEQESPTQSENNSLLPVPADGTELPLFNGPDEIEDLPQETVPQSLSLALAYGNNPSYDANNDGVESKTGAIDADVFSELDGLDNSKLCTRWKIASKETSQSTNFCHGSSDCCAFVDLASSNERWSTSYYSTYNKNGETEHNALAAQLVYYDVNLSPENPYSSILYSDWQELSATFVSSEQEFFQECEETCHLEGFNSSSYTLVFEIEEGTLLTINKISYRIKETINTKPTLNNDFPNITISAGEPYVLNLSLYFSDPEDDHLNFTAYEDANLSIAIEGDVATISASPRYEGMRFTYVVASDGGYSAYSNIFSVTVLPTAPKEKQRIEAGKEVKWVKRIARNATDDSFAIAIPKAASNFTIYEIEDSNLVEVDEHEISIVEGGTIGTFAEFSENKKLGKLERKRSLLEFAQHRNAKITIDDETIPQQLLTSELTETTLEKNIFKQKEKKQKKATGAITETSSALLSSEDALILVPNLSAQTQELQLEYFTESPAIIETETSAGVREILISSDTHYENVSVTVDIPETLQSSIALFWIIDGSRQLFTDVDYIDANGNGKIDQLSWIVPHLSNQTFEITLQVLNVQSYPIVGGNWEVRFTTSGTANLTITGINGTSYTEMADDNGTTYDDLLPSSLSCGNATLYDINSGYMNTTVWFITADNQKVKLGDLAGQQTPITSLFVQDYNCDNDTGYWDSHVITPGKHHQQFNFGGLTAEAHNLATLNNCSELNIPGETYQLSANLTGTTLNLTGATDGVCFNITSNSVTLDCQGNFVNGSGDGYGVYAERVQGITIKNCSFWNWGDGVFGIESGIYFTNVGNSTIKNVNASSDNNGVYISSSGQNNFSSIITNFNNYYGIYLTNSNSNTLANTTSNFNTYYGLYLLSSSSNTLSNITANSNSQQGLYLSSSSSNNIFQAIVNSNKHGLYLDGSDSNNISQITANSNTYGLYFSGSTSSQIFDSVTNLNTLSGVYIKSNSDNNQFINSTSSYNNYSLYISDSTTNNNNFTNFISENSSTAAVYLTSNPTNVRIFNALISNSPTGIYLDGTGHVMEFITLNGTSGNAINFADSSVTAQFNNSILSGCAQEGINMSMAPTGLKFNYIANYSCSLGNISGILNNYSLSAYPFDNIATGFYLMQNGASVNGGDRAATEATSSDGSVTLSNYYTTTTQDSGTADLGYHYPIAAASATDFTVPVVNASFNVTSPIIGNVINFTANVTDETGVSFGQIIVNDTGATRFFNFSLGGAFSAQFSQNITVSCSICVINFTARVNDTSNNWAANTTLVSIVHIENLTIALNGTSVYTGDNVYVYGHINSSNGVNAANTGINVFINGTILNATNQIAKNITENSDDVWNLSAFNANVTLNPANITLKKNSSSQYPNQTGNFTSRVIDSGSANTNFTSISWASGGPYQTEIGRSMGDGTTAVDGGSFINTSGLVLLMHFNNEWGFGEVPDGPLNKTYDFSVDANSDRGGSRHNNGTIYGATFNGTNYKLGNGAYYFDGSGDYIDAGNDSSLNITGAITIVAWIKSNSEGYVVVKDPVDDSGTTTLGDATDCFDIDTQTTLSPDHGPGSCDVIKDLDFDAGADGMGVDTESEDYASITCNPTDGRTYVATQGTYSDVLNIGGGMCSTPTVMCFKSSSGIYAKFKWAPSSCAPSTTADWKITYDPGGGGGGGNEKTNVPFALSTINGGQFLIKNNSITYDVNASANINDGNWHHLASTFNGTEMRVYIDGRLNATSTSYSGNLPSNDLDVWIGRNYSSTSSTGHFNGGIDEVAIWNRTLSANEISKLYSRGVLSLNVSVRSCDDPTCSGESFSGALANSSGTKLNVSITPPNRYFQYKSVFNTEDVDYAPVLYNVTVHYTTLATDSSGKYNFTFTAPSYIGTYTIKVNTTFNGMYGENSINLTALDQTKPRINASLDNSTPIINQRVNMTANVSDNIELSFCQFVDNQSLANGAKQFINKSVAGTSDQCSQNYTIAIAAGSVINFTVIVNDTNNNINQTSQVITVVEFISPIINASLNKSSAIVQFDSLNFTANATDESGLSFGTIIVNDTGYNRYFNFSLSGTEAQFSQNLTMSCSGCVVNFTARVNDNFNHLSQNSTIISVADTIKPRINMSLVDDMPVFGERVNVSANVSDETGVSFCQFITNMSADGSKEYLNKSISGKNDKCSQNYTLSLPAGSVINFTVVVNDTNNNVNQTGQVIIVVNYISKCKDLTVANFVYNLSQHVNASGTCFPILANNVALDCHGYIINYSQSVTGYGVNNSGFNYSTLKSCNIQQADIASDTANSFGVYVFKNSSNNRAFNNSIITKGSVSYGIYLLEEVYSNSIYSNTIMTGGNAAYGVYFDATAYNNSAYSNNITTSNTNGRGVGLSGAHDNLVYSNIITTSNTNADGVSLLSFSYNNNIYSNNITTSNTNADGVSLITIVYNNSVYGNDIATSGSNGAGVLLQTTAYNNSVYSNTIRTSNGNAPGVYLVATAYNNNVYNNNITTTSSGSGVGLLSTAYNNNVYNNNITTTSSGIGVLLQTTAYNNRVYNNTIRAKGTGNGLTLVSTVYNNSVYSNTIMTSGSAGHGIYLWMTVFNNSIYSNIISTNNTDAYGIYLNSDIFNNEINDNNITSKNTTSAYGVYLSNNVNNNTFYRNTISSRAIGILVNGSGQTTGQTTRFNTFTNDTIVPCTTECAANYRDIVLTANATDIMFTHVSFNKSRVAFVSRELSVPVEINNLTVRWFLDINVTNSTDNNPLANAQVVINDSFSTNIFNGTTDGNGAIPTQTVVGYTQNGSATFNANTDTCLGVNSHNVTCFIPYNISVNISGYNSGNKSIDVNRSKFVNLIITIVDIVPPIVNTSFNISSVNNGHVLNFSSIITDETGLQSANISNNMTEGVAYSIILLSGTSAQISNLTGISVGVGTVINFSITATDTSSNLRQNSTLITIVDTIAPTITLNTPTNTPAFGISEFTINTSVSSDTATCSYAINGSANVSMTFSSSDNTCISTQSEMLRNSLYNLTFYANDTTGNAMVLLFSLNMSDTTPSNAANGTHASVGSITTSTAVVSISNMNESVNVSINQDAVTLASSPLFNRTHSLSLTGLSASTTYALNITVCDYANNCISNDSVSFTTSAASSPPAPDSGGGSGGGGGGAFIPKNVSAPTSSPNKNADREDVLPSETTATAPEQEKTPYLEIPLSEPVETITALIENHPYGLTVGVTSLVFLLGIHLAYIAYFPYYYSRKKARTLLKLTLQEKAASTEQGNNLSKNSITISNPTQNK